LYAAVAGRTVASLGSKPDVRTPILPRLKPYLRFSLPAGTVEMVTVVMITVTVMFLGWWHGPEAVAEFRSVFPFGRLNQMVLLTFSVLFAPLATRFFASEDRVGMERAYWQTSAYLTVLSFPIFALSVPLAWKSVPFVFGQEYQASAPVLAVLGTAYFIHAGFGYNALVLQIHGHVRWVLSANVAAMVSSVLVGLLVIPATGAIGVAWSVLGGLLVQNGMNQFGLHRLLGFRVIDPVLLRTAGSSVGLVAALFGLAALDLPLAFLVASAAVASVVLIAVTRASLDLAEVFPAVAKLPLVGRLVSP
jgi:O-antigen/teichoic acid export membrane protein